jgi:hypothetical protein
VAALLCGWRIWQLVALALLFVGGCGFYTAATLLFVTNPYFGSSTQQTPREVSFDSPDGHFKFTCTMKDWQQADIDTAGKLKPLLVMTRRKPASTMVICAEDLHGGQPSDDALKELTLARLRAGFQELKKGDWLTSSLAGKEARRMEIQGVDGSGKFVVGECFTLLHQGQVYLLVFWRPNEEKVSLKAEWEQLCEGFVLLD